MPPMSEALKPETYVAWPQARPMLGGCSRTTVWKEVRAGRMPAAKIFSPGRRAWALSEILAWQAARNQPHKEPA